LLESARYYLDIRRRKRVPSGQSNVKPFVVSILLFLLAACNTVPATPTPTQTAPISVQLSWVHTIEFAGLYEADDKGYYSDAGLTVTMRPGGFNADGNFISPIDEVASGNADFGIADAGALLQARAEGKPVVAIAAIYQRSPVTFMSLADSNISHPEDLVGKNVQLYSVISGAPFRALVTSQQLDPDSITVIERTDFTSMPLVNGHADVIDGWITNEAVGMTLDGIEFNNLLVSDYGIDMYPNVIIASEASIANRPDLVRSFLDATLQGMQAAVDNPEEVAQLAVNLNADNNLEHEIEGMQRSLPLLNPAGSKPGMMQPAGWQLTYETLVEEELLPPNTEINDAYTLSFLNDIYAES
jgi:ABC-type nitrate/sulfonate/bicarbonate transport system substrate-binding protein